MITYDRITSRRNSDVLYSTNDFLTSPSLLSVVSRNVQDLYITVKNGPTVNKNFREAIEKTQKQLVVQRLNDIKIIQLSEFLLTQCLRPNLCFAQRVYYSYSLRQRHCVCHLKQFWKLLVWIYH